MTDDLVKRLLDLADCDARAGEPLGRCMREAAARIEQLTAERDKWKTAFDESCNAWQQQCEYEMDRAKKAEAERDRLREALQQFLIEYDVVDLANAEPSSLTAAVLSARAALKGETP